MGSDIGPITYVGRRLVPYRLYTKKVDAEKAARLRIKQGSYAVVRYKSASRVYVVYSV